MTKVVANIPKKKIDTVNELVKLIDEKRTILIADVASIPGAQYQEIAKKMRGKAILKVPKRNLLLRALDASKKEKAKELKESFKGACAIFFSDLDSYELAADLLSKKSPAKARPGQIAPTDIEIPAGPTELVPGPAVSELGALGIQIMIKEGKIEIKDPKVVAEEGKEISGPAADMLSKLGVLPFEIGFTPVSAYDANDDIIYTEININPEEVKTALLEAYSRALPFAVEIGYNSKDTVPLMIQKAGAYEHKLIRVITGEPEAEAPVESKEEAADAPAEENKQEEKKEEPKADFAASFF